MKVIMFNYRVVVSLYSRIVVWTYRRILVSSYLVFTPYSVEHPGASLVVEAVSRATAIFGSATSNHRIQGPAQDYHRANYGV